MSTKIALMPGVAEIHSRLGREWLFDVVRGGDRCLVVRRRRGEARAFTAGQRLRVSVRLYIVKRSRRADRRIREHPVRDRNEAARRAAALLARGGFQIVETCLFFEESLPFGKRKPHKGRLPRLHTWRLVADVAVADPEAASQVWGRGVGRGKAFGCGLLVELPDAAPQAHPNLNETVEECSR